MGPRGGWGVAIAIIGWFCQPSLVQASSVDANAPSDPNPEGNLGGGRSPSHLPGLCNMGQRDRSGRWINDGTGAMVPLTRVCEDFQGVDEAVPEAPDWSATDERFWAAFTAAANEETLSFAAALEPAAVGGYGQAVCASLREGESMNNIRRLQAEGGLPAGFDAAVNVAAIHIYCPDYAAEIGR
ncbi:MAG: DUF732 domain-containing protein [Leptolyngbyaceae bacterium]|nr:DUF732 domain-containing protein [Leptolyngbyaceae bacterium]